MGAAETMLIFMRRAKEDPRIGPLHISLYAALLILWIDRGCAHPLSVFSHEVMPYCKITGPATYHRSIRQLAAYGYIRYVPSYNHLLGSLVYLEF
jgi:hypothetical protein